MLHLLLQGESINSVLWSIMTGYKIPRAYFSKMFTWVALAEPGKSVNIEVAFQLFKYIIIETLDINVNNICFKGIISHSRLWCT